MLLPLLLGAMVGVGAIASWMLLFPAPPPLQAAINRLHRRNQLAGVGSGSTETAEPDAFERTIGRPLTVLCRNLGFSMDSLEPDLRLTGRSLEQHMAQKGLLALFGLALPVLLNFVLAMFPVSLPIIVGVVVGIGMFFAADLVLRSEAEARRKDFKHSLGAFLDLVVISLAGGAGVESALRDSASVGRGWAFGQLRNALEVTSLTGETPWAALARLGEEVGVPELGELSASVSLAGTEGARVRDSLATKATSLREHALSDAESEAQSKTEAMALPTVLMFLGFLLMIGYPAVAAIANDL